MQGENFISRLKQWSFRAGLAAILLMGAALLTCMAIYWWSPTSELRNRCSYSPIDSERERRTGLAAVSLLSLSEVPPALILAVLTNEDGNFLNHAGFDFPEMLRALTDALFRGKRLRGASTISQQLVKNVFLSEARTFSRKLLEVIYTLKLEHQFSKSEILTLYLNVAQFGSSTSGIAEAASRYFGKPPKDLSIEEASLLTFLIPDPVDRGNRLQTAGLNSRDRIQIWRILFRTHVVLDHFRRAGVDLGGGLKTLGTTPLSRIATTEARSPSNKILAAAARSLALVECWGIFERGPKAPPTSSLCRGKESAARDDWPSIEACGPGDDSLPSASYDR